MSWYRQQLEDWLSRIDVKAKNVLDIGGGALPVEGRVRTWQVKEYIIADNLLEESKGVINLLMDINLSNEFKEKFEVVFCLEVFEYVYNPTVAVRNIYNALENGGIAYITFPFVYPMHQPVKNDYLRYTASGVKKLLTEAGFSRIDIEDRMDKSGKLVEFYVADGMHPAKGENHSATGWLVRAIK